MTQEEAIKALNKISDVGKWPDPEISHSMADEVLLEVLRTNGLAELADHYDRIRDEIGFWYA